MTRARPRIPLLDAMIGVLLPRGCAGCDAPDAVLCPSCRRLFDRVIALPLPESTSGRAYACASYGRCVRRAILAWKDHGDEECDGEFARLIVSLAERALPAADVGKRLLIVPAPSSPTSLAARGRRHLTPLAKALTSYYRSRGIDAHTTHALAFAAGNKAAGNKAVETAGADQRASRTGGGLAVRSGRRGTGGTVRGCDVIVIDDIITTGATMRACADALRDAGGTVVAALALAATPRYDASEG